jgi:hypothetical protein
MGWSRFAMGWAVHVLGCLCAVLGKAELTTVWALLAMGWAGHVLGGPWFMLAIALLVWS